MEILELGVDGVVLKTDKPQEAAGTAALIKKSLEKIVREKKDRNFYVLHEKGKDIRETEIKENPIFVIGDHIGLPKPIYQNLIEEYENTFGYNMRRDNPSNLLTGLDSKILIVHDKNDPTIPYVDSKDISERFRNIELHTTERLGHKRILTDKSVVDLVINYFGTAKN